MIVNNPVKSRNENNINDIARSILEEKINNKLEELPSALKPKHIKKIMDCSQTQAYEALEKGYIPGSKKIRGMGWKINRDVFLLWWYGDN